ncbi:Transcriptional activator spt7 [Entomophthora muscae]|uniref:Transcriptional activator spt7 n=1 Tax=Entomophthora muscae TaxID=34485 RepID=A0ACC2UKX6_9FUNG|nr:Transcriptional activator spt7 [Entomophthora muscae]
MNPIYISKNYPRLSYNFAMGIEETEKWANLLPFPQAQIVMFALKNFDLWTQLVSYISVPRAKAIFCTHENTPKPISNGKVEPVDEADEEDFFEVVDDFETIEDLAGPSTNTIPEEQVWTLDECLISSSAKIREMFFDHFLFSPNSLAKLEEAPRSKSKIANSSLDCGAGSKQTASRFEVHDDYDSNSPASEATVEKAPEVKLEKLDLVSELSKLDFGKIPKTIPVSLDISDMYYDLALDEGAVEEFDRIQKIEVLMESKQCRLDALVEKEAQVQSRLKTTPAAPQNSETVVAEVTPSSPLFNGGGDSLKFLLGFLEERKDSLPAPKNEIRALLEDLKNDEMLSTTGASSKRGFYENLERIVQELIDFKEHSYPFLTPVQRKAVPDYYKKITNPMDLMTVSRKIKAHKYNTKHDFSSDLFLIYSNCRAYNTAKGNEFIYHAKAMEERTKQLLQTLPDNFSKLTPEIPDFSASHTPSKPTPLAVDSQSSPATKDFDLDFGTAPQGSSVDDSDVSHQASINKLERDLALLKKTHSSLSCSGSSSSDPRIGAYRDLTRDIRAHNDLLRFSVVSRDFDSAPFLFTRSNATLALPPTRKRLALGELHSHDGTKRLRQDVTLSMFPELAPSGAVPQLDQPAAPASNQLLLSDLAALKIPSSTATRHMLQNISELKRTRELSDRIATTKDFLENPDEFRHTLHYLNTPIDVTPPNILVDPVGQAGEPELNQASAHAAMGRMAALLLQHAGFDSAEARALEVFTDLFKRHLQSLGQTMQLYMSNHSATMTSEEILLHTLFENKVQGPTDLEEYVTEGIIKHGVRLREISTKLRSKFEGLAARPSAEDDSEMEDGALAGNYEEITGDDFFGFKALGLDRELGLTSLSVPMRLLIGNKRKRSEAPVNGVIAVQAPDYPPPPPFSPLTDPTAPIGLLRTFFTERLNDGTIIDDEFAPPRKTFRPRVPPVGKHAVIARRRQAEQVAQASEKKHKRAQELETRRQQKLIKQKEKEQRQIERKAKQQARMQQKEAEKEKKRLLREEQAQRRKQQTESRLASKSTTTPASPSPDEDRLSSSGQPSTVSPVSSPISSSETATLLTSSPSSTTTSSENENMGMPLDRARNVRRPPQPLRREFIRKPVRPLGAKRPPQTNGIESYALLSSTSEGSFSGSASLSEDDEMDHPSYRHAKPPRWAPAVPPMNPRPSVPSVISNKPRKKTLRPTNNLASPASRNIKRKGPQK